MHAGNYSEVLDIIAKAEAGVAPALPPALLDIEAAVFEVEPRRVDEALGSLDGGGEGLEAIEDVHPDDLLAALEELVEEDPAKADEEEAHGAPPTPPHPHPSGGARAGEEYPPPPPPSPPDDEDYDDGEDPEVRAAGFARGYWGVFRITPKPNASKFGSLQARCVFRRNNDKTDCKKLMKMVGPTQEDRKRSLLRLIHWCAKAPLCHRQYSHMAFEPPEADVPDVSVLSAMKITELPYGGARPRTDVELDAEAEASA